MSRKVIKKQNKKHVASKVQEDHTNVLQPWPDLPQKLVDAISSESFLMFDASYGGLTKSWRAQTKQCNSQAMLLPWLELHDGNPDKKFKFSTSFHQGEWKLSTWYSRGWPCKLPWENYVGCSDGLLIAKGASPTEYYLHLYTRLPRCRYPPPRDEKVPFQRVVICSLTRDPDWRDSVYMVLTGISHPAFVFYGRKAGAKHGWIKLDCNIPDPHNCFNKSDQKQASFMRFTNAIGHKGKFYALSLQGTLAVIEDIDSDRPRITALGSKRAVPSIYSRHFKEFLLESDGEILLVFLISRKSVNIVDDVEVFRLDTGTLSWIKMESIGDRTLFFGSDSCMSVSATKMRCRSDCVYKAAISVQEGVMKFSRKNCQGD